jgi:hypothetical protein
MLISLLIVCKEIIAVYCKHLTPNFRSWSSVGDITTCYGLDGPGIEFQQEKGISSSPKPSRPDLERIQIHTVWVPTFFLVGKTAGA